MANRVPDVASYPKRPEYFIYLSSDGVDSEICDCLLSLPHHINNRSNQSVQDVVSIISKSLTAKLDPTATAEEAMPPDEQDNPSNEDISEVGDSSEYEEIDWTGTDDDEFQFELRRHQGPRQPGINLSGAVERQRKDLLAAKKAGFSVGIVDSSTSQLGAISSLSVPVKRLGVTEFVLEAWDIKPTDHLVLLIRIPKGYPDPEYHFTWGDQEPLFQFQLGKCATPKPSNNSCREAFIATSKVQGQAGQGDEAEEDISCQFAPLYLFNFISKLLENDLVNLMKIRRVTGGSWVEAQEKLYNLANTVEDLVQSGGPLRDQHNHDHAEPKIVPKVPWVLRQDSCLDRYEDLSMPLVAMQCSLQLLVRSGKYCVNCHQRMEEGFQTIRPYVCSRDLCLEHYFSLNLGPGIEHEVIGNPYVVDLLVSFFYTAVASQKLRDFPRGLRLKAPKFDIARPLEVEVSMYQNKAMLSENAQIFVSTTPFRVGERLLLVQQRFGSDVVELDRSLWKYGKSTHNLSQDAMTGRLTCPCFE